MSYVAQQLGVDAANLSSYDWSGRTIKYHRAQIWEAYGFREATRSDEEHLAAWLNVAGAPYRQTPTAAVKGQRRPVRPGPVPPRSQPGIARRLKVGVRRHLPVAVALAAHGARSKRLSSQSSRALKLYEGTPPGSPTNP